MCIRGKYFTVRTVSVSVRSLCMIQLHGVPTTSGFVISKQNTIQYMYDLCDTLLDSNPYLLTIKKAYLGVVFGGATYSSQFMDKMTAITRTKE